MWSFDPGIKVGFWNILGSCENQFKCLETLKSAINLRDSKLFRFLALECEKISSSEAFFSKIWSFGGVYLYQCSKDYVRNLVQAQRILRDPEKRIRTPLGT